ncbi:MAG: hypothetical protein Q4A64_04725 [Porphyromonadaceae bacterium]|nr:hypothetical protein [Porphyromonadaceae bacterium]
MSKLKTTQSPLSEDKQQYQGPEAKLHTLRTPLNLLNDASESTLHLEGDVDNYKDGDEFY